MACLGLWFLAGGCTNTTLDLWNPDLGLLAHWALDESQSGMVADSSGFGNPATPSANPPVPSADTPPVHFHDPQSLSFNGQDQWLEIGNPGLLNLGGPTTFAAWVRTATLEGTRNVVAHGYRWDPPHDFALRIKEGTYQFTTWDSVDHVAIAAIPAEDLGSWVHLCGTFDGATYAVYRNGKLRASTADSTLPPAGIDAVWAIGARAPQPSGGVDYLWQGQIDDVRIYGRALSATDVEALYRR